MSERPYITCRELITFLDHYVGGELPPAKAAEFERHLSVCPSCVAYLATYKETIALAQHSMGDSEIDDSAPEDLVLAILALRRES